MTTTAGNRASHRFKRSMWLPRRLGADRVAGPHLAAGDDDSHNARFTDEVSVLVAPECGRHQTRLDPVQLGAGLRSPVTSTTTVSPR